MATMNISLPDSLRLFVQERASRSDFSNPSDYIRALIRADKLRYLSAHRYVIQKRLKLSGAWWKEDNAKNMLALRIPRANHGWGSYWGNLREVA